MASQFFHRLPQQERFLQEGHPLPTSGHHLLPKGGLMMPRNSTGPFAGWGGHKLPKEYRRVVKKELESMGHENPDGGVKDEAGDPIDPVLAAGADAEAELEADAEEHKHDDKHKKHEPAAAPIPPFAQEGVVNPFGDAKATPLPQGFSFSPKPASKAAPPFAETLAKAAGAAGVSLAGSPLKDKFVIPNLTNMPLRKKSFRAELHLEGSSRLNR